MKKLFLPLFFICNTIFFLSYSQESLKESKHKISGAFTHVNLSTGVSESNVRWISLPGFSLDYDYRFSEKWSLGLHTDIVVEKFSVEKNLHEESTVLERSYPIAPALTVSRKFGHHNILFGTGAEFEKNENLFLNRLGYEYGIEVSEKWEIALGVNYDFRWNAYDSYSLGIVIGRNF